MQGGSFRSVMLRVGELRSLLPDRVCIMCSTAAATFGLRSKVSALLEMGNPLLTYTCLHVKKLCFIVYNLSTVTALLLFLNH